MEAAESLIFAFHSFVSMDVPAGAKDSLGYLVQLALAAGLQLGSDGVRTDFDWFFHK